MECAPGNPSTSPGRIVPCYAEREGRGRKGVRGLRAATGQGQAEARLRQLPGRSEINSLRVHAPLQPRPAGDRVCARTAGRTVQHLCRGGGCLGEAHRNDQGHGQTPDSSGRRRKHKGLQKILRCRPRGGRHETQGRHAHGEAGGPRVRHACGTCAETKGALEAERSARLLDHILFGKLPAGQRRNASVSCPEVLPIDLRRLLHALVRAPGGGWEQDGGRPARVRDVEESPEGGGVQGCEGAREALPRNVLEVHQTQGAAAGRFCQRRSRGPVHTGTQTPQPGGMELAQTGGDREGNGGQHTSGGDGHHARWDGFGGLAQIAPPGG